MKVTSEWQSGWKFRASNECGIYSFYQGLKKGDIPEAPTPVEAFLQALVSCSGVDVVSILEKRRKNIDAFRIEVTAERSDSHPKYFTDIHIEYIVSGDGITPRDVERAIKLSEEKYCSISAMIDRAKTNITSSFRIE